MWDVQDASLREDVDRMLAPSLPGFGGTAVPRTQPTMDDYADAPAAELDRGGVERAVVVGADDGITPAPLSEAMAARIPGATLAVIPGAGHLSNMDAPDEFDRALRDPVRRVAER
ncbi:MAG: hypothetical protein FJ028_07440 [Chloroflexi bacterium]|nr:hypothetical protein [Chloroflexota bacterium]